MGEKSALCPDELAFLSISAPAAHTSALGGPETLRIVRIFPEQKVPPTVLTDPSTRDANVHLRESTQILL